MHHALNVRVLGRREVADIRLAFTFFDAFGNASEHYNIAHLGAAGGTVIDKINLAEWSEGPPPVKIACAVNEVRYGDGSIVKL